MIHVSVNEGTGAGRKRPLRLKPQKWVHLCTVKDSVERLSVLLPGHWRRCPECGSPRPS